MTYVNQNLIPDLFHYQSDSCEEQLSIKQCTDSSYFSPNPLGKQGIRQTQVDFLSPSKTTKTSNDKRTQQTLQTFDNFSNLTFFSDIVSIFGFKSTYAQLHQPSLRLASLTQLQAHEYHFLCLKPAPLNLEQAQNVSTTSFWSAKRPRLCKRPQRLRVSLNLSSKAKFAKGATFKFISFPCSKLN